jgi:hypothetical protein
VNRARAVGKCKEGGGSEGNHGDDDGVVPLQDLGEERNGYKMRTLVMRGQEKDKRRGSGMRGHENNKRGSLMRGQGKYRGEDRL